MFLWLEVAKHILKYYNHSERLNHNIHLQHTHFHTHQLILFVHVHCYTHELSIFQFRHYYTLLLLDSLRIRYPMFHEYKLCVKNELIVDDYIKKLS